MSKNSSKKVGNGKITLKMMRQTLYSAVICDSLDAMGFRNQSPRTQLVQQAGGGNLVGRCKTTLWANMMHVDPNPYELELKAIDECNPDDVFIAAAGGSEYSGIWGELLSTAARNRGCVGAIIDGQVRDVEKMRAMKFNIFARGRCMYDSLNRQRVIDIDVPVEIDGVQFTSGDLVFADTDGVVVIPREAEEEVIRRAWEKVHAENIVRDAIKAGMKAQDAFKKYGVL